MTKQIVRRHVFEQQDALLKELFDRIGQVADDAIRQHGNFRIVLAGGRTPEALYRKLVHLDTDWEHWFIYFGDERCLPVDDPDRNDTMARSAWFNHVAIPPEKIFRIPAELGAEQGAMHYRQTIATVVNFDLVLLGIGKDGHTASLFPGNELGITTESPDVLAIKNASKQPPQRISLSASRLSRSEHVCFLATGETKSRALELWESGVDLPVSAITPVNGVDLYTDLTEKEE
ncbi:6-phosphogluconolactonase [Solemya elarraichensis gill symbiont]|uniref:6-phosphogluconolactonase n=1 Tax=Solemya elarraichensis gill symbiont TaxID=1918949 RepID=A0A1T2L4F2_9GAMM|nr:6-phosphogluconolactonase [Solemya elarraichensis gill symbiont]OOZ39910.1 6-phosphogluconolactonase [Solemya elarraichensis gill symbiont]